MVKDDQIIITDIILKNKDRFELILSEKDWFIFIKFLSSVAVEERRKGGALPKIILAGHKNTDNTTINVIDF